jgi:adenylate cyclase
VVDDVIERADGLRLGGEESECTVLFSDIRGFTTFSETRPPAEVIEVLNRYHTLMGEAIFATGGTLVSYIGDGIIAVFGAPIPAPDHAERAVAAARAMLGSKLDEFNEWMREQDHGEGFRMGVGLNSGPVVAGNIGSERRVEYTLIGDTVNTASRIEGLTKGTPHQLFVSESTHDLLEAGREDLVYVDELEVRGRERKVKLWSLKDPVEQPSREPVAVV